MSKKIFNTDEYLKICQAVKEQCCLGKRDDEMLLKYDKEIAFISTLYNPFNNIKIKSNFEKFYKNLPLRPYIIEAVYENQIPLTGNLERCYVINARRENILWQKERMLNIALGKLPSTIKYIAWVDSDVVFKGKDILEKICLGLSENCIVQLFKTVEWENEIGKTGNVFQSFVYGLRKEKIKTKREYCSYVRRRENIEKFIKVGHVGHAWAARREVIDKVGFPESMIVGSGDLVLLMGMYNVFDLMGNGIPLTEKHRQRIKRYCKKLGRLTNEKVGYLNEEIIHLYHGPIEKRQYRGRHNILIEHKFDPDNDLTITENDLLMLREDKTEMKRDIELYMKSR